MRVLPDDQGRGRLGAARVPGGGAQDGHLGHCVSPSDDTPAATHMPTNLRRTGVQCMGVQCSAAWDTFAYTHTGARTCASLRHVRHKGRAAPRKRCTAGCAAALMWGSAQWLELLGRSPSTVLRAGDPDLLHSLYNNPTCAGKSRWCTRGYTAPLTWTRLPPALMCSCSLLAALASPPSRPSCRRCCRAAAASSSGCIWCGLWRLRCVRVLALLAPVVTNACCHLRVVHSAACRLVAHGAGCFLAGQSQRRR